MRCCTVLLLSLSACSYSSHTHVYGTDFDPNEGDRFIVWPADSGATHFRYIRGEDPHAQPVHRMGPRLSQAFGPETASIIVIQPTEPSEEVERNVRALHARMRTSCPRAGIHLVQDDVDWTRIGSPRAAAERLLELRDAARSRRPASWLFDAVFRETFTAAVFQGLLGDEPGGTERFALMSPIWVMPDPTDSDRFRVALRPWDAALRSRPVRWQVRTSREVASDLRASAPDVNGVRFGAMAHSSPPKPRFQAQSYVRVVVLLSRDLPERSARIGRLAALLDSSETSMHVIPIDAPFDTILEWVAERQLPFPPPPTETNGDGD
ncbi:MAG: hypothetical protein AAGD14_10740 [Planctomycetota bacterium]